MDSGKDPGIATLRLTSLLYTNIYIILDVYIHNIPQHLVQENSN